MKPPSGEVRNEEKVLAAFQPPVLGALGRGCPPFS